ncbi:hypothetical protein ECO26H__p50002 [Escherichia coli O26:H11]|nr:hypothetical protein ECO26H__p50002 [Escherichia coli O26:H11]
MYKSVGYTEKITGVNEFLYTERLGFLYIIVTVSMTILVMSTDTSGMCHVVINVDWPPESPDNQYHLFK